MRFGDRDDSHETGEAADEGQLPSKLPTWILSSVDIDVSAAQHRFWQLQREGLLVDLPSSEIRIHRRCRVAAWQVAVRCVLRAADGNSDTGRHAYVGGPVDVDGSRRPGQVEGRQREGERDGGRDAVGRSIDTVLV